MNDLKSVLRSKNHNTHLVVFLLNFSADVCMRTSSVKLSVAPVQSCIQWNADLVWAQEANLTPIPTSRLPHHQH